jgi:hypothetical protein
MKIIQGKEEAYGKYVQINSEDDYSKQCITAGEAVGTALDAGKSAAESLEAMKGMGLTGYMAAMVAKAIAHFHPSAEGLENGLVNPAIMNVDDDGKMSPEIEAV